MSITRPILRRGSKGTDVKHAQNQLLKVGNSSQPGTPAYFIQTTGGADGDFGPGTYNAVIAYQKIVFPRQPSEHDGIIGPKTWSKLGVNVGDQPAGVTSQPTLPSEPVVGDLASAAVSIAQAEWAFWNAGKYQERDPEVTPRMKDYWLAVGKKTTTAQIQSELWQNGNKAKNIYGNPWSAAFISWVMKEAGAGNSFSYHAAHAGYIVAAKRNTDNNAERFWAFQAQSTSPQVGDIVCFPRENGVTYANIEVRMRTHGDLVVAKNGNSITVIGGNTSDRFGGPRAHTVGKKQVNLTSSGLLPSKYFAIVRIMR